MRLEKGSLVDKDPSGSKAEGQQGRIGSLIRVSKGRLGLSRARFILRCTVRVSEGTLNLASEDVSSSPFQGARPCLLLSKAQRLNGIPWAIKGAVFSVNKELPFSNPKAKGPSHLRERILKQPILTGCPVPIFLIKHHPENKACVILIFLVFKLIRKLVLSLIKFCRNWTCDESLNRDTFSFFGTAIKPPMIN